MISTPGSPNIRIDMNKVGLPPGMIMTLSGETSTLKRFARSAATASRRGGIPFAGVYPWWPSRSAFTAASTIKSGVRKSGCPMPRLIMSRPCAASALARASTAKAFSSPIRSKAAIVRSIVANLPHGRCLRKKPRQRLPYEACTSADQGTKIKHLRGLFNGLPGPSWLAAKASADIAPDLKTDIRIRIIAEIHAAEVKRASGKQVGTSVLHIRAGRRGRGRDLLMLVLLGGIGGQREHKHRGQCSGENPKWK